MMVVRPGSEPALAPHLLQRILVKLGIAERPPIDPGGLNRLYAAYCGQVPNDNIRKRIWLVGDGTTAVTGGDPIEFFEDWLEHGTGGTCFPTNGALCTLLRALGFDATRMSGSILLAGIEQTGNHGSVLVTIGGTDYLADAQLASFRVRPLVRGQAASAGSGIHAIRALPIADGFDVECFPGSNRQTPLIMRLDLARGPVDHCFFLEHYALSARRDRKRSPFNEALFAARRFPDSILIVGRGNRIDVTAGNAVAKTPIDDAERRRVLVEEMGYSAAIVDAIPPDE